MTTIRKDGATVAPSPETPGNLRITYADGSYDEGPASEIGSLAAIQAEIRGRDAAKAARANASLTPWLATLLEASEFGQIVEIHVRRQGSVYAARAGVSSDQWQEV